MSDNIIQVNQEFIHSELKNSVEETLNVMLDAEADILVMQIVMPMMKSVRASL